MTQPDPNAAASRPLRFGSEPTRVVVIDNYDSFTYNLVQYLQGLGASPAVFRNDALEADALAELEPKGILLSPGPGVPQRAGITLRVIEKYHATTPILGVCLGHQAIAECFGARIVRATHIMHGRTSAIHHGGMGLFGGLPSPLTATRYHSLIVDPDSVPSELEVTAFTEEQEIMGLRHRYYPMEGVQFHPESFLTERGHDLLANWLDSLTRNKERLREDTVPMELP